MDLEIVTPRLRLRPTGPEYLESTHAYAGDAETTRYMVFLPNASEAETLDFLARAAREWAKPRPDYYEFAILLDGAHIGGIDLEWVDEAHETGELGWILHPRWAGRGYAREAAEALIAWGREALGCRRFIAHCDSENERSRHLMERLGMRRVSCTGGRKNRGSDEERMELLYELDCSQG